PIGGGHPPGRGLLGLAFVRPDAGAGDPIVIPTPQGTVTTRLTYRPLGPWHVLDRAAVSVAVPQLGAGPEFTVAVLEPRLVRSAVPHEHPLQHSPRPLGRTRRL